MMKKRLTKVGNSSAIVLDRPLMELIGLEEGGEVEITATGSSLTITPVTPTISREQFEASKKKVFDRYRDTLQRLA